MEWVVDSCEGLLSGLEQDSCTNKCPISIMVLLVTISRSDFRKHYPTLMTALVLPSWSLSFLMAAINNLTLGEC